MLDQASPQVGVIQIERQADEKLHVHLYQQISDKAFQKIKKSELRGEMIEEEKVLHCIDR